MNPGRLYRTVRHLSAEQWLHRFVCRGRLLYMNRFPEIARARLEDLARRWPYPDPMAAPLAGLSRHVLLLQKSVHGDHLDGIGEGRFSLINRRVDFGGLERVDWRIDLGEKNNPLWRMNLAYMGYAVPLMSGGEPAGFEIILTLLRSLERQNGWREAGVFRDVWHSYAVSHRVVNLLCALHLYLAAGGRADSSDMETILRHVRLGAAFVRRNLEKDIQYNHLLKNYVALAVYASAVPKPPKELAFLGQAVPRIVQQQVLADGGHAERSPMYHLLTILDLRVLRDSALFAERWGSFLAETIERMERAVSAMSHADGDIALFNDAWVGEAPRADEVAARARGDAVRELPVTGYVRLGTDDETVIFDCGPCGPDDNPGHAHADFLSIEVSVAGTRLIVDPGVPTYTIGELRNLSRSAWTHNGPCFEGLEPLEFWSSFRVGHRGRAYPITPASLNGFAPLWSAAWQDGYARHGAAVARYVGLWPGRGLLVADFWSGCPERAVQTRFLVPKEWSHVDGEPLALSRDGRPIAVVPLLGILNVDDRAPYWPRFGVRMDGLGLRVMPVMRNGTRGAAVLFQWSGPEPLCDPTSLARLLENLGKAVPYEASARWSGARRH